MLGLHRGNGFNYVRWSKSAPEMGIAEENQLAANP
jgi:hypothetical protein